MGEVNMTLLKKEIEREIKLLESLEPGSPEHATAVARVNKLYRLKLDDEKSVSEYLEKHDQMKDAIKERYWKYGMAALNLFAPLCFYGIWVIMGFNFEKTGSITSDVFRGLVNRFRPTK